MSDTLIQSPKLWPACRQWDWKLSLGDGNFQADDQLATYLSTLCPKHFMLHISNEMKKWLLLTYPLNTHLQGNESKKWRQSLFFLWYYASIHEAFTYCQNTVGATSETCASSVVKWELQKFASLFFTVRVWRKSEGIYSKYIMGIRIRSSWSSKTEERQSWYPLIPLCMPNESGVLSSLQTQTPMFSKEIIGRLQCNSLRPFWLFTSGKCFSAWSTA